MPTRSKSHVTRAASPVAKSKVVMKNPSRERLKAELTLLQEEARQLERHLRNLLENRSKARHSSNARKDAFSTDAVQDAVETRRAAERENRQLRAAFWSHLQMGKQLLGRLSEQAREDFVGQLADGADIILKCPRRNASYLHDETGFRLAQLAEHVEQAYIQIDSVFDFCNGEPQPQKTVLTCRVVDGNEQPVIESRETSRIPYDLTSTSHVLWHAIHTAPWGSYARADDYGSDPNVLCLRLESTASCLGQPVRLSATLVYKRFVERHQVAIVWRRVTTLEGQEELLDAFVDETGWILLAPATDENEAVVKRQATAWAPRSLRLQDDAGVVKHPQTGAFTKLVVSVAKTEREAIAETMESLLCDYSITN